MKATYDDAQHAMTRMGFVKFLDSTKEGLVWIGECSMCGTQICISDTNVVEFPQTAWDMLVNDMPPACSACLITEDMEENEEMFARSCHICKNCVCIGQENTCDMFMRTHESIADLSAKDIEGKAPLHLVPMQIVEDIAWVRKMGTDKYKDPDNWMKVPMMHYLDAACRHLHKALANPFAKDSESNLYHIHHVACNIAFICDMMKRVEKSE